jgi:hypothetical protein
LIFRTTIKHYLKPVMSDVGMITGAGVRYSSSEKQARGRIQDEYPSQVMLKTLPKTGFLGIGL